MDPAIAGARAWSLVLLAHDGDVLYANAADRAVAPASTQKLIVADTALSQLGPQYRYSTLFASSKPADGGALDGDLFAVMSGDPSLRSANLRAGIGALYADGIRRITGSVVVDDANEDFMAATSGASIDEDTVEVRVSGTQDGSAARVEIEPPSAPVHVMGSIATGGGDDVAVGGTDRPNEFRLSGSIPAGAHERFWVPVHGIASYA
ncbi:MAG: D-alanyl-D-alanine carboxypeptidase, partial [Candidatus Baltobacteraceae bacterium]